MTIGSDRLKILILEDSVADAKLIQHTLHKDGLQFESRVVSAKDDYIVAIHAFKPHIILSDHSLPNFDSMEALEIAKKAKVDAPFILVTGTVSEEFAVSVIKAGASDYILKNNLSRLTVAVLSALSQQHDREKLKETEEQFQLTIDQMADGVQIIGYDWTYHYVNNIVAQQARCTKEELLGHTMYERFPGIQNSTMYSELKRCMEERVHIEIENEFTFPDGNTGWFKLKMQPVTPGVLILSHDITLEKNNILLLESQNKRIKMVNAAMDRFLYSVSHEFRTPICNGLGLINLLRNNHDEDERMDILNKLEYSIRNLDELLQNIGIFSEIATHESTPVNVDIQQVFNHCLDQMKSVTGRESVQVNLKLERYDPFIADKRRLSIILTNLISNGIKFRDPRKKSFVDVVISINQKSATIQVRDNGIGIKEDVLDKIFDVFYTTHEIQVGHGLGLYMVREIVNKLGGTIDVKSQLNIGTTISVTLPNGKPAAQQEFKGHDVKAVQ